MTVVPLAAPRADTAAVRPAFSSAPGGAEGPHDRGETASRPGRSDRIAHFLRETGRSTLEHVRVGSSVTGGELVGIAAGALAGSLAGRAAGAAVGAVVAGPTGAMLGGALGRLAGMLGGSLLLAKGGAAAGRLLDGGEEAPAPASPAAPPSEGRVPTHLAA